jgi:hypothetical protein
MHILSDVVSRMEDWKHGWVIKCGQKHFTSHHETSARDKNRKIKISEKVGQPNDDRKVQGTAARPRIIAWRVVSRKEVNEALEIPPNQSWFG